MIFSLPFHITRYFRPTFLEVFHLSNAALGDIFAVYGVTAMLAYFPGGPIADRFTARKLMTLSLLTTAMGGFYLASSPGITGLTLLFGYWGITSILLFWSALIRTTREWGGQLAQGEAFGLLEGGRGLVAACAASLTVMLFSTVMPTDISAVNDQQRSQALNTVIYSYTLLTLAAGVLTWCLVPETGSNHTNSASASLAGIRKILGQPVAWLQSVIVICAYCGYKGLDNYSLYAVDVLAMNEVESAGFSSIAAYLRPLAAVAAGFLVDRFSASKGIACAFIVLTISYGLLAGFSPTSLAASIIYFNLIVTFIAVFSLRGIYFALLEETNVKRSLTGTAVGLISVIGFTPDVFFYPLAGRLLDTSPGVTGHQHFFLLLTIIAITGMLATIILSRTIKK